MPRQQTWTMWWSGIFTAAAVAHLARAVTRVPVTIGATEIPVWVSWMIVSIAGSVAWWLMDVALEEVGQASSEALTPTSAETRLSAGTRSAAGREQAGQAYCGIHAGAPDWGDDWPDD
jgi:hypothetical protein